MTPSHVGRIFRQGSRTYFTSSLFFPSDVKDDVSWLYAFVRVADDLVDRVPQDADGLRAFEERYWRAAGGESTGDEVVDGFARMAARHRIEEEWVGSFFEAMRADLTKRTYDTLEEVEAYMHGSAEVIGLMMARILEVPEAAYTHAKRLGKAMQYVNFLRDVVEDARLSRQYIPADVLAEHGLSSLSEEEAREHPERFAALMRAELARYRGWQEQASAGYAHLAPRVRVPIQTAADMYAWTADVIARDPTVVFRRKVKPSVARIVGRLAVNAARAAWRSPGSFVTASRERLRAWGL